MLSGTLPPDCSSDSNNIYIVVSKMRQNISRVDARRPPLHVLMRSLARLAAYFTSPPAMGATRQQACLHDKA
eukprot:5463088-Pleurochrysis_carterae.AAC.1